MKKTSILAIFLIFFFSALSASAKVIRINECIISLWGLCIIETLVAVILVAIFVFFAGTPLRFFLKKYMNAQYQKNRKYKPSNLILRLYSQSSIISMFCLSCIVLIIFFVVK